VRFKISKERYAVCEAIVDSGEFTSVSQVLDFAMHDYYYHLTVDGGKIEFIRRSRSADLVVEKDLTPKRAVVDKLAEMMGLEIIVLADYALEYYFQRRGIVNPDGSYDVSKIQPL